MPIVNAMRGLNDSPYQLSQTRLKKKLIPKVVFSTSLAAYRGLATFLVVTLACGLITLDPGKILASEKPPREVITSASLKISLPIPTPLVLKTEATPTPSPLVVSNPVLSQNFQFKTPCIYGEIISLYFPQDVWDTACRVMLAESGGRPGATHVNKNGSKDIGLFQLNEVHAKKVGGNIESLYDIQTNVRLAGAIYERQGWNPWAVCKNGRVNCS